MAGGKRETLDGGVVFSGAMPIVGLTGGLATGKSTAAKLFRRCGAAVIDADVLARVVVAPDTPAWREIRRTFGDRVLTPDRTVHRAALGHLVFRNRRRLLQLSAIVHPRVAREQARLTRRILRRTPAAIIIYDAPVLIEAGAHRRMDRLVVVTADLETQIRRLRRRNHLSRAEALRRIRSQMPLAQKVRLADYVLDGTLPIAKLSTQVRAIYRELKGLTKTRPRRKK